MREVKGGEKRIDSEARSGAPLYGINSAERSASESGEKFLRHFTIFLALYFRRNQCHLRQTKQQKKN